MLEYLDSIDKQLFLWLNSFHSPFWDGIMKFISGKIEWAPLYAIILAVLIYRFRMKALYIIPAIILTILLADRLSVLAFKEVVCRLRPSHAPDITPLVHIVDGYRGGSYGFVSSHAANSFGLATVLAFIFRNKYFNIFIFFWAALVSYSRIYLGVHYPGDILGGALLGAACGSFSAWLLFYLNHKFKFKIE
ncbi:MAG: phosphatase PAP2 family protein [Bacteroidales bacterium]|nr:phosphatase PAP2 family protein [Bacteroidales bacterium]